MRQNFTFLLLGILVGIGVYHYAFLPERKKVVKASATQVIQKQRPNIEKPVSEFEKIYSILGIKPGDTIIEANGYKAETNLNMIFPAMVEGYSRGHLCVKYMRDNVEFRSCMTP